MKRTAILAALTTLTFVACGGDPSPPVVDCTTATVPTYAEVTMWPTCTSCHNTALSGALRRDAPGGVNYDTYEAAKAHAKEGAAQVNGGLMPPADQPQPTEVQKTAMYAWAMCGTPP